MAYNVRRTMYAVQCTPYNVHRTVGRVSSNYCFEVRILYYLWIREYSIFYCYVKLDICRWFLILLILYINIYYITIFIFMNIKYKYDYY